MNDRLISPTFRRHECGVGQCADVDGQVDVLVDNVDHVVGERQLNIDPRGAREAGKVTLLFGAHISSTTTPWRLADYLAAN